MPTRPPDLDPVAVLTLAIATLSGHQVLAEIVGPYAVILLCALLGATVSATGRPQGGRLHALAYILAVTVGALVVTVPASEIAAAHLRAAQLDVAIPSRWLFGLVAGAIGLAGADLPRLLHAAARAAWSRALRWPAAVRWLADRLPASSQEPRP